MVQVLDVSDTVPGTTQSAVGFAGLIDIPEAAPQRAICVDLPSGAATTATGLRRPPRPPDSRRRPPADPMARRRPRWRACTVALVRDVSGTSPRPVVNWIRVATVGSSKFRGLPA